MLAEKIDLTVFFIVELIIFIEGYRLLKSEALELLFQINYAPSIVAFMTMFNNKLYTFH